MKYKLILIISLQFLCHTLFAEKYHCTINKAPAGKEIPENIIKDYIRHFEYEPGSNKKFHFNKVEAYVWEKGEYLHIILKDLKKEQEVATKFEKTQKEISINFAPDVEFDCMVESIWNKRKSSKLTQLLTSKIIDSSDLSIFNKNVAVEVKEDMEFDYGQPGANGMMRTLLFQDGKVVSKQDTAKPWCIFQIKILLDEDTRVREGTLIEVITVDTLSNSSIENVLSYSFVDFASGRTGYETSRYVPFSLECSVPKTTVLTYGLFKEISGNRFNIKLQN